jgi:NADPH2:quinone reductase
MHGRANGCIDSRRSGPSRGDHHGLGESLRAAPPLPRKSFPGARRLERHWHHGHPDGFCLSLGAEIAVNYRTQDWAAELAHWSQPHGIDAILDMVAGDYFPKHIDLLATGGRLVHIATSHGSQVTTDLRAVMMKSVLITGSTLRGRSVKEKSSLARAVEKEVWPLFTSGQIRPIIDRAFPLEQAAEAHRWMETGLHTGKIILEVE